MDWWIGLRNRDKGWEHCGCRAWGAFWSNAGDYVSRVDGSFGGSYRINDRTWKYAG